MTKVIPLLSPDNKLAKAIKQGDSKAMSTFYDLYSGKMLAICRRYLSDNMLAEDTMIEGLTKAIAKIEKFTFKGSFEGWVRRIIVNECLMKIRSLKNIEVDLEQVAHSLPTVESSQSMEAKDLQKMVESLPDGYRTVFNLYAIEGYSHSEIAKQLQISEGTSKSQLSRARALLKNMLNTLERQERNRIEKRK